MKFLRALMVLAYLLISACSAQPKLGAFPFPPAGPGAGLPNQVWTASSPAGVPAWTNPSGKGTTLTVLNVLAPPYNAKGDGVTDDDPAIQQAVWDASTNGVPFGSCVTGSHQTVYLPAPPVCYAHSKPIRVTCPNVEFKGDADTVMCQSYAGNAIIQFGSGVGNLTYDPAINSGASHSLKSVVSPSAIIDLDRYLNIKNGNINLNNSFASGFHIDLFVKETGADGEILYSAPAYPGTGNAGLQIAYNGSHQVVFKVNTVTGGLVTVGTCTAQTSNTTYFLRLSWNGSTYYSWQGFPGGTVSSCGTASSSNRMTVGLFEDMSLPASGPHGFWPDGSSLGGSGAFVGDLGSVLFEGQFDGNTSSFIAPMSLSADGYTLLLENWDTSLDGTQIGYNQFGGVIVPGVSNNVYLTVLAGAIGSTSGDNIHDLELCGFLAGGATNGQFADGLFASGGDHSQWTNLRCSNANFVGHDFFNNDFDAIAKNVSSSGGHEGLDFNSAWNLSLDSNSAVDNVDGACASYIGGGGGPHHVFHPNCTDRGHQLYAWIEDSSSGIYEYPTLDQEVSSPNFLAAMLLYTPAAPYTVLGGVLLSGSTGNYIQQDGGGATSTFIGTNFSAFGTPSVGVIDFTNGTPTTPVQLINTIIPGPVAISNSLSSVDVIGGATSTLNEPLTAPTLNATTVNTTTLNASTANVSALNVTGSFTNACKAIVTLSSGGATVTNACILSGNVPFCQDTTNPDLASCTVCTGSGAPISKCTAAGTMLVGNAACSANVTPLPCCTGNLTGTCGNASDVISWIFVG